MTGEKIAGALGFAARAGKITVGTHLVLEQVQKGKAAAILFACDAGRDAERKITLPAERQNIPVKRIGLTKKELARVIGKSGEAVCVAIPQEFLNLVLASL